MWNNVDSSPLKYSPNPNSYMVEDDDLEENQIEISQPNIASTQDSGFWSDFGSQSEVKEPVILGW